MKKIPLLARWEKMGRSWYKPALDVSAERRRPGDPVSVMDRKNGEGEEEPVRRKESLVLEQSLEHMWHLFAWACKSRVVNLVIFYISQVKNQ